MNKLLFILLIVISNHLWSMQVDEGTIVVIPFGVNENNELFITCYQMIPYGSISSKNKQILSELKFTQGKKVKFSFLCSIENNLKCKKFNDNIFYFMHEQQANTLIREYRSTIVARIVPVKVVLKHMLSSFRNQDDKKVYTYSLDDREYDISNNLSAILKTKHYNEWDQWLTGRVHHAYFLPFIKDGEETYFYLRVKIGGIYRKDVGKRLDLPQIDTDQSDTSITWQNLKNKFENQSHGGQDNESPFVVSENVPKEGLFWIDYEGNRLYIVEVGKAKNGLYKLF